MTDHPSHTPPRWAACLAITLALIGADATARPVPNRAPSCGEFTGLQRDRCERERELHAICGALPSEARSHCERCFIAANTIPCERYDGADQRQCHAELEALPACSAGPVDSFMSCLNEARSMAPETVTARR